MHLLTLCAKIGPCTAEKRALHSLLQGAYPSRLPYLESRFPQPRRAAPQRSSGTPTCTFMSGSGLSPENWLRGSTAAPAPPSMRATHANRGSASGRDPQPSHTSFRAPAFHFRYPPKLFALDLRRDLRIRIHEAEATSAEVE